jgi:hypothetical protein
MKTYEIIISVLSILTTGLICWQIFTIISIDKIIRRRIKKSTKELEKSINSAMESAKNEALGMSLLHIADAVFKISDAGAFNCYVKAIAAFYLYDTKSEKITYCIERLNKLIEIMKENNKELLFHGNKQNTLNIMYTIICDNKNNIIRFILDCKEAN